MGDGWRMAKGEGEWHNEKSKHGNNGDYNKMPATIATTTIESSNNKGKRDKNNSNVFSADVALTLHKILFKKP